MKSVLLSGLTATAVGYEPAGMNPFTIETVSPRSAASSTRRLEISTTTTELLSALATKRVRPSGDTATPQGVLPSGDCGYSEVEITSRVPSQSRRAGLAASGTAS